MQGDPVQEHLDRLRKSRSLPNKDLSLSFLAEQFKREVAKPFAQLGDLAVLWRELVPSALVERSRLVGLSRGVLHVEVDNPAAHFEIDRLLRGGLQEELIKRHRGPAIRKVSIKLAGRREQEGVDPRRLPEASDSDARVDPAWQPARGRAQQAESEG